VERGSWRRYAARWRWRGKAFDILHVRLVHEFQELPGVGRQGLDIAALPFGIKDVEGQGGFARTAHPGDHYEPVAGQFQIDILEVVFRAPRIMIF